MAGLDGLPPLFPPRGADEYDAYYSLTEQSSGSFPFSDGSQCTSAVRIPRPLAELRLMYLSCCVRNKRRWSEKIARTQTSEGDNATVSTRWQRELVDQGAEEDEVAFVWAELLGDYATRAEQVSVPPFHDDGNTDDDFVDDDERHAEGRVEDDGTVLVEPAGVDGCWQGDGDDFIPPSLRRALVRGVRELEHVDPTLLDWHPGSNRQVLDLVHPSLFPLVRGVTRVTGDRNTLQDPPIDDWGTWLGSGEILPCDFPEAVEALGLPPSVFLSRGDDDGSYADGDAAYDDDEPSGDNGDARSNNNERVGVFGAITSLVGKLWAATPSLRVPQNLKKRADQWESNVFQFRCFSSHDCLPF
jgi:Protein of unknown function (DUF4246)